jgi:hypothetical protein
VVPVKTTVDLVDAIQLIETNVILIAGAYKTSFKRTCDAFSSPLGK